MTNLTNRLSYDSKNRTRFNNSYSISTESRKYG